MNDHSKTVSQVAPWIFTLTIAKGLIPLVLSGVSVVMFKRLGLSNAWAALDTAVLLLPFMLRSYFKPLLRIVKNLRWWVVLLELLFAAAMMGVAGGVQSKSWTWHAWLWLFLAAIIGGMHSMVADEYFASMLSGRRKWSKLKAGSFAFCLSGMVAMGIVLMVAGDMEVMSRNLGEAWSKAFQMVAGTFVILAVAQYALLDRMTQYESLEKRKEEYTMFWQSEDKWMIILIMLMFPMHEWMAVRGASLFMVDVGSIGGLSLGPQEVALVQGTVGVFALMIGSLVALNVMQGRGGKPLFWLMALAVTLPDVLYVYLAYTMTSQLTVISLCVFVEQFLLGFGMPVYLLYIYRWCQSGHFRARLDICTALIALSLVVSGMMTGLLQDLLGYRRFFAMVTVLAVLTLLLPLKSTSDRES